MAERILDGRTSSGVSQTVDPGVRMMRLAVDDRAIPEARGA
jgi:hypothetical protein